MFARSSGAASLPRLAALIAATIGLAAAAPHAAGQAEIPVSDACNRDVLAGLIVAKDPNLEEALAPSEGFDPLSIICVTINGDDIPDALWTLQSGGSGGAFNGGVAVSGFTADQSATLAEFEQGRSHLVNGFVKGKPAIGYPKYRKADANCCPTGGWRWRTYTAKADGTVKRSKLFKSKKKKSPIKAAQ